MMISSFSATQLSISSSLITFRHSHCHFTNEIPTQISFRPYHQINKKNKINIRPYCAMEIPSQPKELIELNTESDFKSLISPYDNGYLSICGFGSLLSERSSRSTFPDLINFRIAELIGFRRVFAHTSSMFFERRIANPQTQKFSRSVNSCDGRRRQLGQLIQHLKAITPPGPSSSTATLAHQGTVIDLDVLDGRHKDNSVNLP
ncbi:hypothetical protein MKX03_007625, partial [Papaver bracteatum]